MNILKYATHIAAVSLSAAWVMEHAGFTAGCVWTVFANVVIWGTYNTAFKAATNG